MWSNFPARPLVMGILNATPDSFSDSHATAAAAIEAGLAMIAAGADIIDVGGESTRPGSQPVSPQQEQDRVLPVIAGLVAAGVPLSIDTRNSATMEQALQAGAVIINDVTGLSHDAAAAVVVARHKAAVILMHMRGTPATMNSLARYQDLVAEVADELANALERALAAGIAPTNIALDPGIGFAKTADQNQALLRALPAIAALGYPLIVGVSRKRFIGRLTRAERPADRDPGSLAAGLFALSRGARVLRVHDVAGTVQAVRVWHALAG